MKLVSLLLLFIFTSSTWAGREVSFEWESVEGAKGYQVELRTGSSAVQTLKSKIPLFSSKIPPGRHEIRGRTLGADQSGSYSDWSSWKEFVVPPPKPKLKSSKNILDKVASPTYLAEPILDWELSEGSFEYDLVVTDQNGVVKTKLTSIKGKQVGLKLRPGVYSIKMIARTSDGVESTPLEIENYISVDNVPVEPPKKLKVDRGTHCIAFEKESTAVVNLRLDRQDFLGTSWTQTENKNISDTIYCWGPNLKPGKYKVTLMCINPFEEKSISVFREFVIKPKETDLPL